MKGSEHSNCETGDFVQVIVVLHSTFKEENQQHGLGGFTLVSRSTNPDVGVSGFVRSDWLVHPHSGLLHCISALCSVWIWARNIVKPSP